jgi:hypothetical protein
MREVSPFREIWLDFGSTHQSPMRSRVVAGGSMQEPIIAIERKDAMERDFRSIQEVSEQTQDFACLDWVE